MLFFILMRPPTNERGKVWITIIVYRHVGKLVWALCSNLSSNAVLTFVLKKHCAMPLYCTKNVCNSKNVWKCFLCLWYFCPKLLPSNCATCLALKCYEKNHLKKYQSLWKCPTGTIFNQCFELKSNLKSKTLFQLKNIPFI